MSDRRPIPVVAQSLILVLVPLALAAPGLLGFGHRTALDAMAAFIAAHPFLHNSLLLPVNAARDGGYALLAIDILLLGGAGLAGALLLRTLDLTRTALIGGVLLEFAGVSSHAAGWQPLAALLVCPLFIAALERLIRGMRPSVLRLAVAISLVFSFSSLASSRLVFAFGVAWACARLASPGNTHRGRTHRGRVLGRLALASALGTLLAAPLLAARLAALALHAGVTIPEMPSWLGVWSAAVSQRVPVVSDVVALLPTVGLAVLAALPMSGRGRALRVLLVSVPALVAVLAFVPVTAGAPGLADARPLFLTCLVTLCCVSFVDAGRVAPAAAGCIGATLVLVAVAAVRMRFPIVLASANSVALVAGLALAGRRQGLAAVPVVASAAWTAVVMTT